MAKSILGNHLSKYRDMTDKPFFSHISINIADFDKALWEPLALDIMKQLFLFGCSVDYGIHESGMLVGKFTCLSDKYNHVNNLYVDTQLVKKSGGTFLIITKRSFDWKSQVTCVLNVTDDGMWLAYNRDHLLEDSIESELEDGHCWSKWTQPTLQPDLIYHLDYNIELYNELNAR